MIKEANIRAWSIIALVYVPTFGVLLYVSELLGLVYFAASLMILAPLVILSKKKIISIAVCYTLALVPSIYSYYDSIHTIYVYNGLEEEITSLNIRLPGSFQTIHCDALESDYTIGTKYRTNSFIQHFGVEGLVDGISTLFVGDMKQLDGHNRFAIELTPQTIETEKSNKPE